MSLARYFRVSRWYRHSVRARDLRGNHDTLHERKGMKGDGIEVLKTDSDIGK
jgi:hypothetical protein